MPGYATAGWEELKRLLKARRITVGEIERVRTTLSPPDPAGVIVEVTREHVARVAIHMNPMAGRLTYFSPWWELILAGHPAARAVYYHELVEIAVLADSGVADPTSLPRSSVGWLRAHARACWQEADYWKRWAAAEGEEVPREAFLLTHPGRDPEELSAIRELLAEAAVSLKQPNQVELQRATAFYRRQGLGR